MRRPASAGRRVSRTPVLNSFMLGPSCPVHLASYPIKASTNASGSNGARSSGPSPSPTSLTGTPSSRCTAITMPPFAVPSSFVRTIPVMSTASAKTLACRSPFWPVVASSTSRTSSTVACFSMTRLILPRSSMRPVAVRCRGPPAGKVRACLLDQLGPQQRPALGEVVAPRHLDLSAQALDQVRRRGGAHVGGDQDLFDLVPGVIVELARGQQAEQRGSKSALRPGAPAPQPDHPPRGRRRLPDPPHR